ncbi:MAG: hypothetical protein QW567_00015 [Candidatus Hadarchaeales archaeon]
MTKRRKRPSGTRAASAENHIYRSLLSIIRANEGYGEIKALISKKT